MIYETNTRHVCTFLYLFSMAIPTIDMKFNNVDIFEEKKGVTFWSCRLLTHACRVESVYQGGVILFMNDPDPVSRYSINVVTEERIMKGVGIGNPLVNMTL